ncbi:hypothetical protein [Novosphingobium sp. 9]|uniref:hypothetical protein n=1 Tax=Novosphingobium sp. 9 TaxID=2025349 RepID=UPI0021B5FD57|nr:hypothetical protein [Novosphingobium sp. 9]
MTAPKLSPHQLLMLRTSHFDPKDGCGFGVGLRSAATWRTARSLEKRGLGWIQGGHPNGSEIEGLFFANRNGTEITFPAELEAFRRRTKRFEP